MCVYCWIPFWYWKGDQVLAIGVHQQKRAGTSHVGHQLLVGQGQPVLKKSGGFPKMGNPQNGWFIREHPRTSLKNMTSSIGMVWHKPKSFLGKCQLHGNQLPPTLDYQTEFFFDLSSHLETAFMTKTVQLFRFAVMLEIGHLIQPAKTYHGIQCQISSRMGPPVESVQFSNKWFYGRYNI